MVVQPNSPQTAWDHRADDDRVWAFIEQIVEDRRLDQSRVHMGGHSMGADMTWRCICDHSDVIASAAPAATGLVEFRSEPREVGCDLAPGQIPEHEVDILYVHGTADSMVPFEAAIAQRDAVIAPWAMEETEIVASGPDFAWTRWTSPAGTVQEFVRHDWSGDVRGPDTVLQYGEVTLQFYIEHPKDR